MTQDQLDTAERVANIDSLPTTSSGRLGQVLIGLLMLILFAAIYGRLMDYGLRRDEMMFVPPAVLLGDWAIYDDFFYNHLPYSAWYFRAFYSVLGGMGLLFATRFGIFVCWIGFAAALGWLTWRITFSSKMVLFNLVALLTFHALMNEPGMAATNNLLPLPFALLGLGLFVTEISAKQVRLLPLFAAGLCLSIATGMKASAVAFVPPVAIAAFFLPADMAFVDRLKQVVLPVLIGGLVGALPLFFFLFSDPDLFIAHVLGFHTGPHVAYWEANKLSQPGLALGLGGKLQLAYGIWFQDVALILGLVALCMFGINHQNIGTNTRRKIMPRGPVIVVIAALFCASAMSFMPTPGFEQYYIPPLICLPLLIALLYARVPRARLTWTIPVLNAATVLLLILALPWLAPELRSTLKTKGTVVADSAKGGKALYALLEANGLQDQKVATFLPTYPLEGGLSVYPELATGQFAYRIAPFTEPLLARQYSMVGAEDLAELFDTDPPAAFLLGYEPDLEAALMQYALSHGYKKATIEGIKNRYGDGIVYLKP